VCACPWLQCSWGGGLARLKTLFFGLGSCPPSRVTIICNHRRVHCTSIADKMRSAFHSWFCPWSFGCLPWCRAACVQCLWVVVFCQCVHYCVTLALQAKCSGCWSVPFLLDAQQGTLSVLHPSNSSWPEP